MIIILSITVLVALFSIVIHSALQPKPFNWDFNLRDYNRQPYGTYVLHQQLENIFPGKQIKRLRAGGLWPYYDYDFYGYVFDSLKTYGESMVVIDSITVLSDYDNNPYDSIRFLEDIPDEDVRNFNFLSISPSVSIADYEARALMQHVYNGNHVLISAFHMVGELAWILGIKTEERASLTSDDLSTALGPEDLSITLNGVAHSIKYFDQHSIITSFPDSAEVIATDSFDRVVGVKVRVGRGSVTFFTLPMVFTNYYLLKDGPALAESLLMGLPDRDTFWARSLMGPYQNQYPERQSLLAFIHSKPSLKWAFYIILFSLLLFFAFQIRRRQRAVPFIPAPENVSLRFTETISNLYLQRKDNRSLVEAKMQFFLDMIRTRYQLDTNRIDDYFYHRLTHKSGVPEKRIRKIFQLYNQLIVKDKVTDSEFLEFSRYLQNFKND